MKFFYITSGPVFADVLIVAVECSYFVLLLFSACSRIVQLRYPSMPSALPNVPSTPNHSQRPYYVTQTSKPHDTHSLGSQSTSSSGTLVTTGTTPNTVAQVL